jgi:hypothetical protein
MARLRHADRLRKCPFCGVDRKSSADGENDAIDPIRKLMAKSELAITVKPKA